MSRCEAEGERDYERKLGLRPTIVSSTITRFPSSSYEEEGAAGAVVEFAVVAVEAGGGGRPLEKAMNALSFARSRHSAVVCPVRRWKSHQLLWLLRGHTDIRTESTA